MFEIKNCRKSTFYDNGETKFNLAVSNKHGNCVLNALLIQLKMENRYSN